MADSIDQKIVLTSEVAGGKEAEGVITDIAKDTSSAAEHAAELMKVIEALNQKLAGINSDAATALKKALSDLAQVINTLDVERLAHLEEILKRVKVSGNKLTDEGMANIAKDIEKVNKKATEFKDAFSNKNGVRIGIVFDGEDKINDLRERIAMTEEANDLIEDLKKIADNAQGGEAKVALLKGEVNNLIKDGKNLTPENLVKMRKGYESVLEIVSSLGEEQRKAFEDVDFDALATKLDGMGQKFQSVKEAQQSTVSASGTLLEVMQGNFNAIGTHLETLVKKLGSFKKLMAESPARAAAAIGAIGLAVQGVVTFVKQWVTHLRDATQEMEKQKALAPKQQADTAMQGLEYFGKVQERQSKKRDAKVAAERSMAANMDEIRKSEIQMGLSNKLANGHYSQHDRKVMEMEAQRATEDIDLEAEQRGINDEREDHDYKRKKDEDRMAKINATLDLLGKASAENVNASNHVWAQGEDGMATRMKQIADKTGITNYQGDLEELARMATESGQSISEMIRNLREEKKDLEVEMEADKAQTDVLNRKMNALGAKRAEMNAERRKQDEELAREEEVEQEAREYEVAERERRLKEAKQSYAEIDPEGQLEDVEARLAKLKKKVAERRGIKEEDLMESDWQDDVGTKEYRDRLEARRDELKQKIQVGDTEGYSRKRQRQMEKFERDEADRQQMNEIQEQVMGPMAKRGIIQKEMGIVDERMKKTQAAKKEIEAKYTENGKFVYERMSDADKQKYEDLRSDWNRDLGKKRDLRGQAVSAQMERADRFVDFRENIVKQGNRLTGMGLGGGGGADFGKETAGNTKSLVELTKMIMENTKSIMKKPDGKGQSFAWHI